MSSDNETKANKPYSSKHDSNVNRHSRTHSHARGRYSRSRSRSPYRASRGEKRRRLDDSKPHKNDTRTFKVRYEDERRDTDDYRSGRSAKRSRTHSPSRSRSRSPFRHEKAESNGAVPSTNTTNTTSVSTQGVKRDEQSGGQTSAKTVKQNPFQSEVKADVVEYVVSFSYRSCTKATTSSSISSTPVVQDEAAIIEARRKRREAIKNQYRGQARPLLVQALGVKIDSPVDSPISTPNRSGMRTELNNHQRLTSLVSPSPAPISTPTTPTALVSSVPSSPMAHLAREDGGDDMFGSPRQAVDEPSAADYDPTADMQEERARHDKRLFKEDEDTQERIDQQVREQTNHTSNGREASQKNEFDMFAEGDDDDMFAEPSDRKPQAAATSAKKLDEGMMDNWDDAEGYYLTNLHEKIDDRYEVVANLGRGMFASVVRAMDEKLKRSVAIKIIRNNESMKKAGAKEVDILKDLAANDPEDRKHVVRLLRSFEHKGHLCMVFENMDMNLREVLKKFGRDIGLNLKAIRAYAQQLFLGLSLLKKCQYLHADLKPDNILADESRMKVKIADLGSASPITENVTAPYLVSRFYRAPEIILGIEYDYGIDMWSVGCTLYEMYTGKILFTGRNNNNMLKSIMDCRGKFPHKLLRKGSLAYEYFDDLLNFRSLEQDKTTGRTVTKIVDIKAKPVKDLRSRLIPKDKRINEQEKKELESFVDLLDKCLDLRPDKRITPNDALKHPFIMKTK